MFRPKIFVNKLLLCKAKLSKLSKTTLENTTKTMDEVCKKNKYTEPSNNNNNNNEMAKTIKNSEGHERIDLSAFLADLDRLYSTYKETVLSPTANLTVGSLSAGLEKGRNSQFSWWKPVCTMLGMIDFTQRQALTFDKPNQILDILKDFTIDQKSRKSIVAEFERQQGGGIKKKTEMKKPTRRANSSAKRMADRKAAEQQRKQFALREIESGQGETHYYVIRTQQSKSTARTESEMAVEDIFADWRVNLSKRRLNRRPRTRKISHREQRKEVIRAVADAMPKTYAQAVQKNLR